MNTNNLLPKVSVICLCYNHEKYIKEALDSILAQKTDFNFEIIVHDDASTDNSQKIIMDYYNRYPDKIIPILQVENQYSKKINLNSTYIYPKVRGKYIALCECDDYWIDETKLQKQVEYLDKHNDCSACIHAAYKINARTKQVIKKIILSTTDIDFTIVEAIEGLGSVAATNSFIYRAKYIRYITDHFTKIPQTGVGDYLILLILGLVGKIHYMNEIMSVYRSNVDNSWTDRMSNSIYDYLKYLNNHICMLYKLYNILPAKYYNVLNKEIDRERFKIIVLKGELFVAKREFPQFYKSLTYSKKIKIIIRYILLKIDSSGNIFNFIMKIYKYFVKNDFKFSQI